MSAMSRSFLERRHDAPDIDIDVWITGVRLPNGMLHLNVVVEGESDSEEAAVILERAAKVLRQ